MTAAATPLCILLPGADGTGLFYDDFRRQLHGIETRVLTYPQTGAQAYERLGTLLLSQLLRDQPYILIAESFAGPLAIWLTAHAPHKPAGLVLAATFAASPFGWPGRLAALFAWCGYVLPMNVPLLDLILFNGKERQQAVRLKEIVQRIDRSVVVDRVRVALSCDMRGWLNQVTAPVLALQPNRDRLLPRRVRNGLEALPDIERIDLELPHMVFQADNGREAAVHVLAFVSRLFGDASAL